MMMLHVINKILTRIHSQTRKRLAYIVRVQLVNSVLMNVQAYWASVFLLPKYAIHQVRQEYRRFLQRGDGINDKVSLLSWDLVCRPKVQGSLSIKDASKWNIASISIFVQNIAYKEGTLQFQWIHHIYLKGADQWSYKCPQDASWV